MGVLAPIGRERTGFIIVSLAHVPLDRFNEHDGFNEASIHLFLSLLLPLSLSLTFSISLFMANVR